VLLLERCLLAAGSAVLPVAAADNALAAFCMLYLSGLLRLRRRVAGACVARRCSICVRFSIAFYSAGRMPVARRRTPVAALLEADHLWLLPAAHLRVRGCVRRCSSGRAGGAEARHFGAACLSSHLSRRHMAQWQRGK